MNDPANKNALTLPVSAKTSISIVDGSNNQKIAIAGLSNSGDYEDSIFLHLMLFQAMQYSIVKAIKQLQFKQIRHM